MFLSGPQEASRFSCNFFASEVSSERSSERTNALWRPQTRNLIVPDFSGLISSVCCFGLWLSIIPYLHANNPLSNGWPKQLKNEFLAAYGCSP